MNNLDNFDTLNIASTFGRNGNNLVQLLNAIHVALECNINKICVPTSIFANIDFSSNNYHVREKYFFVADKNNLNLSRAFSDNFFNIASLVASKINNETINFIRKFDLLIPTSALTYDVGIHLRGGDTFNSNPHPHYVQPPFEFYRSAVEHCIKEGSKVFIVVFEDERNPALPLLISYLQKRGVRFTTQSSSIESDLSSLMSVKNLISSYSHFILYPTVFSKNLLRIYLPHYARNLIFYSKISDREVFVGTINDYIEIGEWHANLAQLTMISEYSKEISFIPFS